MREPIGDYLGNDPSGQVVALSDSCTVGIRGRWLARPEQLGKRINRLPCSSAGWIMLSYLQFATALAARVLSTLA